MPSCTQARVREPWRHSGATWAGTRYRADRESGHIRSGCEAACVLHNRSREIRSPVRRPNRHLLGNRLPLMSIFCHATQRTQNGYQAEDADPVERGIMSKLDDFHAAPMRRVRQQGAIRGEKQAAGETFPLAHHVNTACNDKILGLPMTLLAPSWSRRATTRLTAGSPPRPTCSSSPRREGRRPLTSYDAPEGNDKRSFSYATWSRRVLVPCASRASSRPHSAASTMAYGRAARTMFSPVMRFHSIREVLIRRPGGL